MYVVKRWNLATATTNGYDVETFAGHMRFSTVEEALQFAEKEKSGWDHVDILEGRATDNYPDLNLFKSYQKGKEQ